MYIVDFDLNKIQVLTIKSINEIYVAIAAYDFFFMQSEVLLEILNFDLAILQPYSSSNWILINGLVPSIGGINLITLKESIII